MRKYFLLLCLLVCVASGQAQTQTCPNFSAKKVMDAARLNPAPNKLALISAHRGIWEYALENTVQAVDAAVQNCIEISEVDVRMTSDGFPAMIHDWYLQRSTTGTGLVYDMTYDQWTALHLRDRFGKETTQTVPLLGQFLDYMVTHPNLVLVLDCKDTLSVGKPTSPYLKTSAEVLAITYKLIKNYEDTHPIPEASLRDRIVFKMRFPEMGSDPVELLHKLGIQNCNGDDTRTCTHLNVTPIWYGTDTSEKFPDFDFWKQRYLIIARISDSWIWYPEVVVKYPNDILQSEGTSANTAGLTITAFAATSDWAEGTSMGSGQCCGNRNYNFPLQENNQGEIIANFTGDYEYYVALQGYGWISSDKAIEADNYLKARNKRDFSYITQ